jgi:uncharacterized protein YijF (DUF1287 family)
MNLLRAAITFCLCFAAPGAGPVAAAQPDGGAIEAPKAPSQLIVEGARREAEHQTPYVMEYHVIPYPGGDVPADTGVCTDLVVRAFRNAGIDVQKLLHVDRAAHPEVYPTQIWAYKRPDANIDHRRCQNLAVWFRRQAKSLAIETDAAHLAQWQPGDVVFYVRSGASDPWHVAVVSERKDADGMPLIIDSYPPATSETHRLDTWSPIHSHFRYPSEKPKP